MSVGARSYPELTPPANIGRYEGLSQGELKVTTLGESCYTTMTDDFQPLKSGLGTQPDRGTATD